MNVFNSKTFLLEIKIICIDFYISAIYSNEVWKKSVHQTFKAQPSKLSYYVYHYFN